MTPKTGISLMFSAFTWGAFGFGLKLSAEELGKVNAHRQQLDNNTYECGKLNAAQALCTLGNLPRSDKKVDLNVSPSLCSIFPCKAADGNWANYYLMHQIEDVVDVFRAL